MEKEDDNSNASEEDESEGWLEDLDEADHEEEQSAFTEDDDHVLVVPSLFRSQVCLTAQNAPSCPQRQIQLFSEDEITCP